jgi:transcriptional regulator with XRE-family HTH domain
MLDAERVRMTRLKYRISQRALAEMIGQRQSYISRLERGDITAITVQTLEALADALNVTTDYLLGREESRVGDLSGTLEDRPRGRRQRILEEDDEKQLVAAAAL